MTLQSGWWLLHSYVWFWMDFGSVRRLFQLSVSCFLSFFVSFFVSLFFLFCANVFFNARRLPPLCLSATFLTWRCRITSNASSTRRPKRSKRHTAPIKDVRKPRSRKRSAPLQSLFKTIIAVTNRSLSLTLSYVCRVFCFFVFFLLLPPPPQLAQVNGMDLLGRHSIINNVLGFVTFDRVLAVLFKNNSFGFYWAPVDRFEAAHFFASAFFVHHGRR